MNGKTETVLECIEDKVEFSVSIKAKTLISAQTLQKTEEYKQEIKKITFMLTNNAIYQILIEETKSGTASGYEV